MRKQEDNLQSMCVQWFRMQYPKSIIFHTPNAIKFMGDQKNNRQRNIFFGYLANLKKLGLLKGIPDLFIAEPCNGFAGLFIEMKIKTGQLSEEQKEIISRLRSKNYAVAVCKSFDEFESTVKQYFGNRNAETPGIPALL